jgi:hypothetical protein
LDSRLNRKSTVRAHQIWLHAVGGLQVGRSAGCVCVCVACVCVCVCVCVCARVCR